MCCGDPLCGAVLRSQVQNTRYSESGNESDSDWPVLRARVSEWGSAGHLRLDLVGPTRLRYPTHAACQAIQRLDLHTAQYKPGSTQYTAKSEATETPASRDFGSPDRPRRAAESHRDGEVKGMGDCSLGCPLECCMRFVKKRKRKKRERIKKATTLVVGRKLAQ